MVLPNLTYKIYQAQGYIGWAYNSTGNIGSLSSSNGIIIHSWHVFTRERGRGIQKALVGHHEFYFFIYLFNGLKPNYGR